MCKVLQINRSTIYKKHIVKSNEDNLLNEIHNIFVKHKSCYGYRRLKIAIEKEIGLIINHKKLLKIMRNADIFSNWVKRFHSKNRKRNYQPLIQASFNLLQRNFTSNKSNEKWVTDITYIRIPYQNKYLYLSTIIDLYTKKIVAYKISEKNNLKLVIETLKAALVTNYKEKLNGLILHSDQGFQYTSIQYKNLCRTNDITPSYSRKGTPLDNAVIESFHAILKKETIYNKFIKTKHDMINLIHEWINFYQSYRVRL